MSMSVEEALDVVRNAGYVVLKAKSYRQAQERQRVAEALLRAAEESRDRAYAWARDCCDQERYLRDRCTFLYGVAERRGATRDELRGFFDHQSWMAERSAV